MQNIGLIKSIKENRFRRNGGLKMTLENIQYERMSYQFRKVGQDSDRILSEKQCAEPQKIKALIAAFEEWVKPVDYKDFSIYWLVTDFRPEILNRLYASADDITSKIHASVSDAHAFLYGAQDHPCISIAGLFMHKNVVERFCVGFKTPPLMATFLAS